MTATHSFPFLNRFFLGCLVLAAFAMMGVREAKADQCVVTCPPGSGGYREAYTDTRRCTAATAVRDCSPLCDARCPAGSCSDSSQYKCSPATLQLTAATAFGTCGFTCDGSSTPPNVVIPCNTDVECAVACDNTCATTANRACGGSARCVPKAAGAAGTTPAQTGAGTQGSSMTLTNPLGANTTFQDIIARIIRAMIGLVGSIALLMFIYGGIRWMVAGGSEKEVTEAKNIIKYAVIGLLMIFFSYTLVSAFLAAFSGGVVSTTPAPTP